MYLISKPKKLTVARVGLLILSCSFEEYFPLARVKGRLFPPHATVCLITWRRRQTAKTDAFLWAFFPANSLTRTPCKTSHNYRPALAQTARERERRMGIKLLLASFSAWVHVKVKACAEATRERDQKATVSCSQTSNFSLLVSTTPHREKKISQHASRTALNGN